MASLEKQIELFNRAGCKVLVISFGEIKGAASWLSATGCNLEMFLDPERRLYTSLGLPRSVSKVWGMTTMHYYAGELAQDRELPSAIKGVEDDPLQMGGDFTFRKSDRKLVMSHPSKTPKDRPALSKILSFLK